jgi:hypothetical protein
MDKMEVLAAIAVGVLLLMLDFGRPWIWLSLVAIAVTLAAYASLRRHAHGGR